MLGDVFSGSERWSMDVFGVSILFVEGVCQDPKGRRKWEAVDSGTFPWPVRLSGSCSDLDNESQGWEVGREAGKG